MLVLSFVLTTGCNCSQGKFSEFVYLRGPQVWMAVQGSVIISSSIWLKQISVPPCKSSVVSITVYDVIFLSQAAELNMLSDLDLLFPWKERVPGAGTANRPTSEQPLARAVCAMSVQTTEGTLQRTCWRLWVYLYTILPLLHFSLSLWKSLLAPAPTLATSFIWVQVCLQLSRQLHKELPNTGASSRLKVTWLGGGAETDF